MRGQDSDVDARALLCAWRSGDVAARDRLFDLLYGDLRQAAAAMLRGEQGISLSIGDLVNEGVVKLVGLERIDWQDRAHFLALASRMMRRVVIEHIRAKRRNKRDHQRVELQTNIPEARNVDVEDLNHALDRLASIDAERAEIVEMRYFGGMEISDIAVVLDLSESTVKRRWNTARLWLREAMDEHAA